MRLGAQLDGANERLRQQGELMQVEVAALRGQLDAAIAAQPDVVPSPSPARALHRAG